MTHLRKDVEAPDGEIIEVSTLTRADVFVRYPETCLFFEHKRDGRGSRVVETYSSANEAVDGHYRWINTVKEEMIP